MLAANLLVCGAVLCSSSGFARPFQDQSLVARDGDISSDAPIPPFGAQVSNWTGTQLNQLAVNLEQLEVASLDGILNAFHESDFESAGYESWVRNRLLQMQSHEHAHLAHLTARLTATNQPVPQSCNYSTVNEFIQAGIKIALISLCGTEQVVQSAYLGLANQIGTQFDPAPQFAAEEARHQGWILASVLKEDPWSGPWDTILTADQAAVVPSIYASSCPEFNPKFPAPSWPSVSVTGIPDNLPEYDGPAGAPAQIHYVGIEDKHDGETWINIQSGLGVTIVPVGNNGTFTVPSDVQGFAWGMVVSTAEQRYTSDQIVAGPVGFHCGFNSTVDNSGLKPVV